MKTIIPDYPDSPTTERTHRFSADQKLIIHYTLNGHVICEAEGRLTAGTRFIELPIPVIHQMTRGTMK